MPIDRAVRGKTMRRIVLPLVLLTFVGSLDRVNLSFAASQMNRDLGLDPKGYGLAVGIFFVTYILCQLPSVALLARVGARRWLCATVAAWSVLSIATAFVHSAAGLLVLRVLLGIAEAGFAPGMIYIMSRWTPPRFRGQVFATPMLAVPASVVLGGPLCGWLVETANPIGLAGWRWMLLVLGIVTAACLVVILASVSDRPEDATWLEADERDWLVRELDRANVQGAPVTTTRAEPSRTAAVGMASLAYFALLGGTYGITFWLPQAVQHLSHLSPFQAGCVAALPWAGVALGIYAGGRRSDRSGARLPYVVAGGLIGSAGMAATGLLGANPLALIALIVAGFGLGTAQGVFWTVPPLFLGDARLRHGVPIINSFGSLSGFVVPLVVGALRARTGGFTAPIFALAALIAVTAAMGLLLVRALGRPARPKASTFTSDGALR